MTASVHSMLPIGTVFHPSRNEKGNSGLPLPAEKGCIKEAPLQDFSNPVRTPLLVGATRFELAAPWSQTKCATKLRYAPTFTIHLFRARNTSS